MSAVDLLFPVRGTVLPIHHAYPLFAALSGRGEGVSRFRDSYDLCAAELTGPEQGTTSP